MDEDTLPFGTPAPEAAITTAKPRRHRHVYEWMPSDRFVVRNGETASMRQGRQTSPTSWETEILGCLCGHAYNPAASRRGRLANRRGKDLQRKRIQKLGGLNLAGNNENLDGIGGMFAYESKSGGSFSERYWRWLKGIPTTGGRIGLLIVTDAPGPGHKARSMVIVDYDDWRDLHGEG